MSVSKLGKFQERIKKIRLYRTKGKFKIDRDTSVKIVKVVIGVPLILSAAIKKIIDFNRVESLSLNTNLKKNITDYKEKVLFEKAKLEVLESDIYVLNTQDEDKNLQDDVSDNRKKIDFLLEKITKKENEKKEKNCNKEDKYKKDCFEIEKEIVIIENNNEKLLNAIEIKMKENNLSYEKLSYIKEKMLSMEKINNKCKDIIKYQNTFIDELNKKINHIDAHMITTYKVSGFNSFLEGFFKYMATLFVSPLTGLIPTIAVNMAINKKMFNNLATNINIKKQEKIVYEAKDYDFSLLSEMEKLNKIDNLIDSTISDISKIKKSIPINDDECKKFLIKLDHIYDNMVVNKYKVKILKERFEKSKKINSDKLVRVKILNEK